MPENSGQQGRRPLLVVVTGPTASGKTELAIRIARHYGSDIISADSRQIFRGIPIGTASPTVSELAEVRHHFVGTLDLADYYSAACFESDVMQLLPQLWEQSPVQVMCGGSMLYIDAVVRGIDTLPTISDEVRVHAAQILQSEGPEGVISRLRVLDPDYLSTADKSNPRRLVHALEICIEAGEPYSRLRTGQVRERPFDVVKMAIDLPREVLFERINRRVAMMVEVGFEDEARSVYPLRHLNSLNTVGYKEMFACFDGRLTLDEAIARMAKNTRVYAKKQLTWLRRSADTAMLPPLHTFEAACQLIDQTLQS